MKFHVLVAGVPGATSEIQRLQNEKITCSVGTTLDIEALVNVFS